MYAKLANIIHISKHTRFYSLFELAVLMECERQPALGASNIARTAVFKARVEHFGVWAGVEYVSHDKRAVRVFNRDAVECAVTHHRTMGL